MTLPAPRGFAPIWTPALAPHEVRSLIREGKLDTYDIARKYGLKESQVWNILARGDGEATP